MGGTLSHNGPYNLSDPEPEDRFAVTEGPGARRAICPDCFCAALVGYPLTAGPQIVPFVLHEFCVCAAGSLCTRNFLAITCDIQGKHRLRLVDEDYALLHADLAAAPAWFLFGALGAAESLYTRDDLQIGLERYRAAAIRAQNERRLLILLAVLQLTAHWGLGRDIARAIIEQTVPRLRGSGCSTPPDQD